jgi:hypothetical protein
MTDRIISTREVPGGLLREKQIASVREINLSPTFVRKEKPWTLVKIPKSSTKNVAWHVRIDGINLLFTQVCSNSQYVSVTKCSDKAKVNSFTADRVAEYNYLVDLETAVDKYYNEDYIKPQPEPEANEEPITE